MGRRVKRRGVQEHAACTMAARYQLPRGWFPVLPIALGGRLTSTGTQRRKDAEKFVQKKLCASATLRHDRCNRPPISHYSVMNATTSAATSSGHSQLGQCPTSG